MTALIILTILLLIGTGYYIYRNRKLEKQDYEEYMARRITFSTSKEFNSEN